MTTPQLLIAADEDEAEAEALRQRQQEKESNVDRAQLQQLVGNHVSIEVACQVLGMTIDKLEAHLLAVTAADQSPWLKGNILRLMNLWREEHVGLVVHDVLEERRQRVATREAPIHQYQHPFRPELRTIGACDEVSRESAAIELAVGIKKLAANASLDNVNIHLLTGCSGDVAGKVLPFLEEHGYAEKVPATEAMRSFRITGVSEKIVDLTPEP